MNRVEQRLLQNVDSHIMNYNAFARRVSKPSTSFLYMWTGAKIWKKAKIIGYAFVYSQGFIDLHPEFSMSFSFLVTTVKLFLMAVAAIKLSMAGIFLPSLSDLA
jgi:hypothetical protein